MSYRINLTEEQIKGYVFDERYPQQPVYFDGDSGIDWFDPTIIEIEKKYGNNCWVGRITVAYIVEILMLAAIDGTKRFCENEEFVIHMVRKWTKERNYVRKEEYRNKVVGRRGKKFE